LALSLAACSSSSAPSPGKASGSVNANVDHSIAAKLPAKFSSKGVIKNIIFNNSPPATFQKDGKEIGWAVDLSDAIAGVLGVKLETTVSGDFSSFIPGLQNGRYDGSFGPLIVTADRLKQIDIVGVFKVGTGFISKAGSAISIKTATDVCGLTVAAIAGSAFVANVNALAPKCSAAGKSAPKVQSYPSNADAELAVSNGRAQVFASNFDALKYVASQTGSQFNIQPLNYQPIIEGIGLTKNNGLSKPIAAAVDKLIADGTYGKILQKWGLTSDAVTKAQINPASSS
jgi:polar amino acid transport system substrate-binding protein